MRLAEAMAGYAAVILENANAHAALEDRAEALAASEDRFRKLSEELEQRVIERTAELQAANDELEAFSYSVSHDLRAPLRSMDGFCQVLLEDYGDRLDAEGLEYLRRVRMASQRMADLIDGLLGLSRVTRTPITREPVDLSALATSIVAGLRDGNPARDVAFEIAPGARARGDQRLLRVVLENLLRNAWKFTAKHDSARIRFGVRQDGDERVFFVTDDGAGFDMAYQDKLFGAFQRLHGMTEFEGTGIGLATVQRIIHRHGGRVWAEGEVERGATFSFTLDDAPAAVSSQK
jgi:light-regulated signal transduction histidine kinase (bacteriophytochrome)